MNDEALAEIAARCERLEAVEAIRQLKARRLNACAQSARMPLKTSLHGTRRARVQE